MKKKYTQQDIDQFFGNFKDLPEYFELEKVHQLINNPATKATQTGNINFKPFKFFIMTSSVIIVVVSALLLWPEEPVQHLQVEPTAPITAFADSNKQDNVSPGSLTQENKEEPIKEKAPKAVISSNSKASEISPVKEKREVREESNTNSPTDIIIAQTENHAIPATLGNIWSRDTIIDGTQLLISLTDEELEKLGFMLNESGIYYKNAYNGDTLTFHSRMEYGSGEITNVGNHKSSFNKKNNFSNKSFFPVANSDLLFSLQQRNEEFKIKDDTLAPVIIKSRQGKSDDDIFLWFKVDNQFFDDLPTRYEHLRMLFQNIHKLKKLHPNLDIVNYEPIKLIDNIDFIELSEKELETFGFYITGEAISYETFYKNQVVKVSLVKGGESVSINEVENGFVPSLKVLSFLSNPDGQQRVKWKLSEDDKDKMKSAYFQEKNQFLVPIIIQQKSFPDLLYQDEIFWFEPSEALFDALPVQIGQQIRQEYHYLTAVNEEASNGLSASCTFFESCKATLQLNGLKLYPNPAAYISTLSFDNPEETIGAISLVNISGNHVKELISRQYFQQGLNTFQLDLSGVGPGIYLIYINTNKGFKTQRLIISL